MRFLYSNHRMLDAIASEISRISAYYDRLLQVYPLAHDSGYLLGQINCRDKQRLATEQALEAVESANGEPSRRAILLHGNLNHSHDVQQLVSGIKPGLGRDDRLITVMYNPYYRWIYQLADRFGLRKAKPPVTFITRQNLLGLCELSGFELVRLRPVAYSPFKLLGLGRLINTVMPLVPLLRHLAFTTVAVMRPVLPSREKHSLSVIVPARNEAGNIEAAIERLPSFDGADIELIFVEGHSRDDTWEKIQQVLAKPAPRPNLSILGFQQSGIGKKDAVDLGFAKASKDLLTILDADLTMPPELLERFYFAYCDGHADFVNGNRLLYPMEPGAMRTLNHLGNVWFAKALSWMLDVRIGDSLCGTKLFAKHDLQRLEAWWQDFGGYDPFGDYFMLYSAAGLGLGMTDIPIRYRSREYGDTNILRFRHGWMLMKIIVLGWAKIKSGYRLEQRKF